MRLSAKVVLFCALSGIAMQSWGVSPRVAVGQESTPAAGSTFVDIFDGKTLAGWYGCPHLAPGEYAATSDEQKSKWQQETAAHWTVADGELINDGDGPYLTTGKDYGDYELLIEYRTVARADSGIYLRGVPQVQIWDYTDPGKFSIGADKGSGALWNNSPGAPGKDPLVLADKPFGEWNALRIVHVGERVSVWLNDKHVVDHARMENFWDRAAPLPKSGPIQLQTHGGEIRWRNIKIRELSSDEANEILSSKGSDGFSSIFDGQSLEGWQGAVDDYQVVDGSIQCRPGRGGNLYTKQTYGDFVARVEFKVPPGGNNGLAIRYPGKGNPAYDAMTELQVLDNEHESYAKLDPRQYHGSAYGMAAAKRGFLRPAGEWNFQEVTVQGSTIKVELNGTVILNTDLSTITEVMDNSPHPGKDLKEGFFGFAGHGDNVAFRNLSIKPL
jgi:hypothetical protein